MPGMKIGLLDWGQTKRLNPERQKQLARYSILVVILFGTGLGFFPAMIVGKCPLLNAGESQGMYFVACVVLGAG